MQEAETAAEEEAGESEAGESPACQGIAASCANQFSPMRHAYTHVLALMFLDIAQDQYNTIVPGVHAPQ